MRQVRTRFAPSPTGFIHVGGIRTALFAWLVAKGSNGKFILRIEDTDRSREVSGAKEHIIESLNSLGLNYDEGPDVGGDYGPYIQSERLNIYRKWADKLVHLGRAYTDPFTAEELEEFRAQAKENKQPFLYRNHRPEALNSWLEGKPLRFRSDPKEYTWHDEVMGELKAGPNVIDDFILIKSDGYPTYNFAHIIDDKEMNISHVIRGQEYLSSVPNYLNLYEALNISKPIFATMPHVLGPSGTKKLSKRDGAKDILEYITEGYLPDALLSFIATLGWNDGTTQEIFTREELIQKFKLARVQRAGAHFDINRLNFINGSLIRQMDINDLYDKCRRYWPEEAKSYPDEYKLKVIALLKDRLKYLSELKDLSLYFFNDLDVNRELINSGKLKDFSPAEKLKLLQISRDKLINCEFTEANLIKTLNNLLKQTNQTPSILFSLIRVAITQSPSSPGLADTMTVLGKDTSIRRIDNQIAALK